VNLCVDGKSKSRRIHRLVAEAFIPRVDGINTVLHRDGDPVNCQVSNLKWGTPKENAEDRALHGNEVQGEMVHSAKLNQETVLNIRTQLEDGVKVGVLARIYNVSHSAISNIRTRVTWKHI